MGSEMGDSFKEHRQEMKERKEKEGIDCPGCKIKEPKRVPSRLLPGWTCKVCGHKRLSTVNDSGKMKITLSKSQWEDAGRKAGWITASADNVEEERFDGESDQEFRERLIRSKDRFEKQLEKRSIEYHEVESRLRTLKQDIYNADRWIQAIDAYLSARK